MDYYRRYIFNKIIYNIKEKYLFFTALFFSYTSFVYYFSEDLITAYGDSKGHLNITRRVVDSLTPGLAQLGGYWLPAYHTLMLPTIWIDYLWFTGISGSIVSTSFFILSVLTIYKLAFLSTENKLSSFLASLVLLLNFNFLYIQTTPMTETMFVSIHIIFAYYFYKYIKNKKVTDLIISAIFVLILTLTRYEGWGVLGAAVTVLAINYIRDRTNFTKEGQLILFTSLASMGIVFWLLWGLIIFFNPIEFLTNDLSAGNQTFITHRQSITGYLNPLLAFLTNIYSSINVNGFIVTLVSIASYIRLTFKAYRNDDLFSLEYMFLFVLISPFLFDVLSVFLGEVPVEVKELSGSLFNIRYSLFLLPFAAFVIANFTRNLKIKYALIALIIINAGFLIYKGPNNLILLSEAGVNLKSQEENVNLKFFKEHYDYGLILASTGSMDGFMFDTKIPQKNYIVEGSFRYWQKSMVDPSTYARWVLISVNNDRDLVNRYVNKDYLYSEFDVIYDNGGFQILKIKEN